METVYGIEFNGTNPERYWNDTFWPSIYTQGGYLGLVFYALMLVFIFREFYFVFSKYKKSNKQALLIIFGYAFIASLLESFFTNDSGVTMALVLVIVFGKKTVFVRQKVVKKTVLIKSQQTGELA